MAILVPNSGSTYSTAGCVIGSENKWVWLGFTPTPGGSGSVMWYKTSVSTSGSKILAIVCPTNQTFIAPVPFNSPNGFYAGEVSGGCAIAWVKQSTH